MRKSLEAINLAALAFMFWVYWNARFGPGRLPDRVPTHFDLAGNPNGWDTSSSLPLFSVVAVAIYLMLTLAVRFPAYFNYPVEVTAENRPRLEALTVDLIAWLKTEIICLFAWIQWVIIDMARRGRGDLSLLALLPVFLVVLIGTLVWFIVAMRRAARTESGS
jgi:uncharacterized membrane protein